MYIYTYTLIYRPVTKLTKCLLYKLILQPNIAPCIHTHIPSFHLLITFLHLLLKADPWPVKQLKKK